MVIQCSHCQTRFKLADDKLKPEGTKVRCSKCREIFTVFPPESDVAIEVEAAPPPPVPATGSDAFSDNGASKESPQITDENHEFSFDVGDIAAQTTGTSANEDFGWSFDETAQTSKVSPPAETLSETTFDTTTFPQDESSFAFDNSAGTSADAFDFDGPVSNEAPVDFPPDRSATGHSHPTAPSTEGGFDEFAFDDTSTESNSGPEFAFDNSDNIAAGGAEFSFDAAPTTHDGPSDFAFDDESSSGFSWETNQSQVSESPQIAPAVAQPATGEFGDFDFSGLSFGEEENTEQSSTGTEGERIPLETSEDADATRTFAAAAGVAAAAGATMVMKRPDVSEKSTAAPVAKPVIAAKPSPMARKISPNLIKGMLIILVLVVVSGGVYFWQQQGFDFQTMIGNFIDKKAPETAVGQIELNNLSGSFIKITGGEYFVIRGTAINQYKTTRSAILVKGILYDKNGKTLKQQSAYCGNPLDDSTLRSSSIAKIDEAMGNQFGDSMLNLNLAPGKGIPFTIVFKEVPASLAEFTVEVVDSKPGSK